MVPVLRSYPSGEVRSLLGHLCMHRTPDLGGSHKEAGGSSVSSRNLDIAPLKETSTGKDLHTRASGLVQLA